MNKIEKENNMDTIEIDLGYATLVADLILSNKNGSNSSASSG